jgi:peptidoglycan lytic transglycosylase
MKTATDRPRRKDRSRAAALLSALVVLALAVSPAQAETGGASTLVSSEAQAGEGIAFEPLRWAGATWYGPGLYGNRTACGQVLRPETLGVAHRSLPCGTVVKFAHRGYEIVTTVIDRGPFTRGNAWDLTNGARRALRFGGAGPIRYAVSLEFARGTRRPLNGRRPG